MTYNLFIDDMRVPLYDFADAVLVKSMFEAEQYIQKHGVPEAISFDHDLGEDENGRILPSALDLLSSLIEAHLDGHIDLGLVKRVVVHSSNPPGVKNIIGLWNGFAKHIGSPVQAEARPRKGIDE